MNSRRWSGGSKGSTSGNPIKISSPKKSIDMSFSPKNKDVIKARKASKEVNVQMGKKELRAKACKDIRNWFNDASIPIQAITFESFAIMCDSFGRYGPGFKPPSVSELRAAFIKNKVEDYEEAIAKNTRLKEENNDQDCKDVGARCTFPRHKPLYKKKVVRVESDIEECKKEEDYDEANDKNTGLKEEKYDEASKDVDTRCKCQLHKPLYAAKHFLNPKIYYSNPKLEDSSEVMAGLYDCIIKLTPDYETQCKIFEELNTYKSGEGLFGYPIAIRQRKTMDPKRWWSSFGSSAQNLKQLAIRVLDFTCSATECVTNSGVSQNHQTKKRNRLAQSQSNCALKRRCQEACSSMDPSSSTRDKRKAPIHTSSSRFPRSRLRLIDGDEEEEEETELDIGDDDSEFDFDSIVEQIIHDKYKNENEDDDDDDDDDI